MFRNPFYLLWLAIAFAAVWILIRLGNSKREKISSQFGNLSTLARLLKPETSRRRNIKSLLQLGVIVLLFLALAGPQWGIELSSSKSSSQVVLLAVDTSLSMLTEDVSPSRLEKARNELDLIVSGLKEEGTPARIGVIVFSGQATLACPLTTDLSAVSDVLSDIHADMLPTPGTAMGNAINLATQTLSPYAGNKNLILLSDGGDHGTHPGEAAQEAAAHGIRVFTLGFGTTEGGPIPIKDASGNLIRYQKNKSGTTVITHLRPEILQKIAAKSGGNYWQASATQDEISDLLKEIAQGPKSKGIEETAHVYKNHFLIPLSLAFLLLLIEFLIPEKRGALEEISKSGRNLIKKTMPDKKETALLIFFTLLQISLLGSIAKAGMESDLRQGNNLYGAKQYAASLNAYISAIKASPNNPKPIFNAGDAFYRLGKYGSASKAFTDAMKVQGAPQVLKSAAYYNIGNSAFQKSQYAEAAAAYRNSLILNPNSPEAAHNLAVALHYLKHPPPKKKNQKKNNPKNKKGGGGNPPPPPPRPSSSQQNQKQQQSSQSQNQLSKDDLRRVLSSVTDKKPNTNQQLQKGSPSKAPDGEDW